MFSYIIFSDLVRKESSDEDIRKILPTDNELVIREDSDLIGTEENLLHHSLNVDVTSNIPINATTFVPTSSNLSDKINSSSNEHNSDEIDEEFERNFLRAVNRALGVVNKSENHVEDTIDNKENETIETNLNLIQMTEQAISSLNNSTLFTVKLNENKQTLIDIYFNFRVKFKQMVRI